MMPEYLISILKVPMTDVQLNRAFLDRLPISIWQDGELVDHGLIELHIRDAVKVNGTYYVKSQYKFRIIPERLAKANQLSKAYKLDTAIIIFAGIAVAFALFWLAAELIGLA